jgi:hypothetical protein
LTLHQVRDYLFSEGMITEDQYKKIIFEGYQGFEDGIYMTKREVVAKTAIGTRAVDLMITDNPDYSSTKLQIGMYDEEHIEPEFKYKDRTEFSEPTYH